MAAANSCFAALGFLDTLGPFSEVVVSLLASIAKLEREKIRERMLAGLPRAWKQGWIGGRPKAENAEPKLLAQIGWLRSQGQSIRMIAAAVGRSPNSVLRRLCERGQVPPGPEPERTRIVDAR